MRWIISALIVAATTFCGYRLGDKYKVRDGLFNDLILFVDFYLAQIKYKGNKVAVIMDEFCGKEIGTLFSQYKEQAGERINITHQYLTKNECDSIGNFFSELGRSDAEAQSATVKGYREIFSERYEFCRDEKKRYGGLYTKLGLLLGLLIAILIA